MPDPINFPTDQIYTLVNEVVQQAVGDVGISAVDASTLVSLGNAATAGYKNVEPFLNELAMRIGKTIFSYREYRNKYRDMMLNDYEYGAFLQKIKVKMPTAKMDNTTGLEDGQSYDPWIINKPKATQKLFYKRTPYDYYVTIQTQWLKEAFLSADAMAGFISMVFGETRNAIELGIENLGRVTLNNFAAETEHEIKLVTLYNNIHSTTLTPATAVFDTDFLAFAIKTIRSYMDKMTDMSTLYNDGTETRHTPLRDQRIKINTDFMLAAETVLERTAFNPRFVELDGYQMINFWQSQQTPMSINVTRASDETAVTIDNIIGMVYDRDALGIYQYEDDVLSTPVNARTRTYNVWYHERQLWFNDLSENFLLFTLN